MFGKMGPTASVSCGRSARQGRGFGQVARANLIRSFLGSRPKSALASDTRLVSAVGPKPVKARRGAKSSLRTVAMRLFPMEESRGVDPRKRPSAASRFTRSTAESLDRRLCKTFNTDKARLLRLLRAHFASRSRAGMILSTIQWLGAKAPAHVVVIFVQHPPKNEPAQPVPRHSVIDRKRLFVSYRSATEGGIPKSSRLGRSLKSLAFMRVCPKARRS